MNELIVGIDLGTTNSAIAAVIDGEVKVLPVHGQPTMPSVVGLDSQGKLLVGGTAKNQLVAAPANTIQSIKRTMGESSKVTLGDREFSPEEISSLILRELKQAAEGELGEPVRKAVITVPAYFQDHQRRATQTAGQLAGLEVVRIINEPTAAALAYGAGKTEDETLLVYDLGGGTFDVSLVVVEEAVVEVKASHGDTHLGGDDFDQALADHVRHAFEEKYATRLDADLKTSRRLSALVEPAKCRLSDMPHVQLREEYFFDGHHLEMEIERIDYEEMIEPWLQRTMTCLHQTLVDGGLQPSQIDKVMLVGGASRTPRIYEILKERLALEPRFEIDPDLIVAMGAAVQGGIIAGKGHNAILVDITSHTYSTATFDGLDIVCVPIIRRNTPLPAKKAETFLTLRDNQESVRVEVFQGESTLREENRQIGEFVVEGLSEVPAGNPVTLELDLDLNGVLQTTATEKNTGLAKSVSIDTKAHDPMNLVQARQNIAALLETDPATAPAEAEGLADPPPSREELLAAAKDLRKRAQALLEQKLNPEDAREVQELLEAIRQSVRDQDWPVLAHKCDALGDILFYLED